VPHGALEAVPSSRPVHERAARSSTAASIAFNDYCSSGRAAASLIAASKSIDSSTSITYHQVVNTLSIAQQPLTAVRQQLQRRYQSSIIVHYYQ
jgi:hypothetical protein